MIDRRRYLTGAATLAAVALAPIGTGAFTSESESADALAGSADVEVVPREGSEYVDVGEDGRLSLAFGEGDRGLNRNATVHFDGLFALCNRGETPATVTVEPPGDDQFADGVDATTDDDEARLQPYAGADATSLFDGVVLEAGECVDVGLRVNTHGVSQEPFFEGGLAFRADELEG